jgi:hypothetical protein
MPRPNRAVLPGLPGERIRVGQEHEGRMGNAASPYGGTTTVLYGNPRSTRVEFLACVNAMELERPTDAESERSAGMRIRAADEGDVGREHVHPRERVGDASAGVKVIVPQKTIVL